MYTLYYLNRNLQLGTIKVLDLDTPVKCPEDLVFCALRKGIYFQKEPHECIGFTDMERLIIYSEFSDMDLLKELDFRKQNTYLESLCLIDGFDVNFDDADVKYVYDEGNALEFPQDANLPQGTTNIYLSLDGINFTQVPNYVKPEGWAWSDVNRLYYSRINDIIFTWIDLVNSPISNLPNYMYFQNALTGQRSKVYNLTPPPFNVVKTLGHIWDMNPSGNYVKFQINRLNATLRYSLPDGTILGNLPPLNHVGDIYEYNTKDVPYEATVIDFVVGLEVFRYVE